MADLFRAEWRKIIGNRWVVGLLIWVYPAGAAGLLVLSIIIGIFAPETLERMGLISTAGELKWTSVMLEPFGVLSNIFGRTLLIGFCAVTFAGEYRWGTWKNLLPRRSRIPLLLIKFLAVGIFVLISYVATSLILGFGSSIPVALMGGRYGPELTGPILAGFVRDYVFQMGIAFISTMIAAGFAALGAIVTRSILGSVLVSLGFTYLEAASLALFYLLGLLFDRPGLIALYRFTPTYNLENAASWAFDAGAVINPAISQYAEPHGMGTSVLVLATWVAGLIALAVLAFRRQDITT